MIDGDGNVRITDFGIATRGGRRRHAACRHAAVHGARAAGGRAGDDRAATSTRSGWCSSRSSPANASHEAQTLRSCGAARHRPRDDAVVDRAAISILLSSASSCAVSRSDPQERPPSALAVAAALPGGDPLAAALAPAKRHRRACWRPPAKSEALPVARARCGRGASVVCAARGRMPRSRLGATVARLVPLDKTAGGARRSRRADPRVVRLCNEPRGDSAHGFVTYNDYVNWHRADRSIVSPLARWPPAVLRPSDLLVSDQPARSGAAQLALRATPTDPPATDAGMHSVMLDTRGRLVHFTSVPPLFDPDAADRARLAAVVAPASRPRASTWPLFARRAAMEPARLRRRACGLRGAVPRRRLCRCALKRRRIAGGRHPSQLSARGRVLPACSHRRCHASIASATP